MLDIVYVGNTGFGTRPIQVKREEELLRNLCDNTSFSCSFKPIVDRSIQVVRKEIQESSPTIFHLGCHGLETGELGLKRDRSESGGEMLTPQEVVEVLEALGGKPRLVIVSACNGLKAAKNFVNAGLADCSIGFDCEITEDEICEFFNAFYEELFLGLPVSRALRLANIVSGLNGMVSWKRELFDYSETYRVVDPPSAGRQEGESIHGYQLEQFIDEDDLGVLWWVRAEETGEKRLIRFLHWKPDESARVALASKLRYIKEELSSENSLLVPVRWDLEASSPMILYRRDQPVIWNTLSSMMKKSSYPLSEEREVKYVYRVMKHLLDLTVKVHELKPDLTQGRLNASSVIMVDSSTKNSSTFGEALPIITELGMDVLSERNFKNSEGCLSPWIQNGEPAWKVDDLIAIGSLFFSFLSGKNRLPENFSDVHNWFDELAPESPIGYETIRVLKEVHRQAYAEKRTQVDSTVLSRVLIDFFKEAEGPSTGRQPRNREDFVISSEIGLDFMKVESKNQFIGPSPQEKVKYPKQEEGFRKVIKLKTFYISETVLTLGQVITLAKSFPNEIFARGIEELRGENLELPFSRIILEGVERKVTWQLAKRICEMLTRLHSSQHGHHFFLPTEAQWEMACRAETTTFYNTGRDILNVDGEPDANVLEARIGRLMPAKFGQPNVWGLYACHGNTWEYCENYFSPAYSPGESRASELGKMGFFQKRFRKRPSVVIKGGDFLSPSGKCRSSSRDFVEDHSFKEPRHEPSENQVVGIRVVCFPANSECE